MTIYRRVRTVCLRFVACCAALTTVGTASAEVGLTSQPEPLGYPGSIDDEADAAAEAAAGSIWPSPRRADEPQVPAGFDPYRSPERVEKPSDLIAWFQEPAPSSCCDRNVVDRAWMGPGELAYHRSPNHRPCTRDYTRVFRTEFPGRLWISAEYLVWATSEQMVPPLVTSSASGSAADAVVLFGGDDFSGPMRSGARLTAGFWFTPRQDRGIEASWVGLAFAEENLSTSSTGGNPWLARPYVDASTGQPAELIVPASVSDPTLLAQSIDAQLRTQFGSVDVLYRTNLIFGQDFHRRYLTGGFRYLMLDDQVSVESRSTISSGVGSGEYTVSDSFQTLSEFYGGEFGLVEKWWRNRWSLQVLGKVALGASSINTTTNGTTTTPTDTFSGGVLAQATNPGGQQSMFAAIGEVGVTADYALWSQFRVSVGYSLIYWSTVGRAAAQIDTSVNPSQFYGGQLVVPIAPVFTLSTSGFWAQGVNVGLEYQF